MDIDVGRANRALMDGLQIAQIEGFKDERLRWELMNQRVSVYISIDEGASYLHESYSEKPRLKVYLQTPDGEALVLDMIQTQLNHGDAVLAFRDGSWVDYQMKLAAESAARAIQAAVPAEFKPINDSDLFKD